MRLLKILKNRPQTSGNIEKGKSGELKTGKEEVEESERNFTLIELLIVIAIIAILASFLMPALNTARRAAYRASCMSNQRQLGYAFHGYMGDNNGVFPAGLKWGAGVADHTNPWSLIFGGKYATSWKVVSCPGDDTRTFSTGGSGKEGGEMICFNDSYKIGAYRSYCLEDTLGQGTSTNSGFPKTAYAPYLSHKEPRPTKVPFIVDFYNQSGQWCYLAGHRSMFYWVGYTDRFWRMGMHHDGTGNFLMADGHVENIKATQIISNASSLGNAGRANIFIQDGAYHDKFYYSTQQLIYVSINM